MADTKTSGTVGEACKMGKNSNTPSSPSSKRSEPNARKRFFSTESIPRLSHTDPLANELIAQEVNVIIIFNETQLIANFA